MYLSCVNVPTPGGLEYMQFGLISVQRDLLPKNIDIRSSPVRVNTI